MYSETNVIRMDIWMNSKQDLTMTACWMGCGTKRDTVIRAHMRRKYPNWTFVTVKKQKLLKKGCSNKLVRFWVEVKPRTRGFNWNPRG